MKYINKTAKISKNVTISNGCYIGENVIIGENTYIGHNTVILDNTTIGKNCIIENNVIIGKDGFGFINDNNYNVKIPQIGKVIINDGVIIDAFSCVDKATLKNTIINNYSHIGHYVTVGHNVKIGKAVGIGDRTGICGSAIIEDKVHIGKRCGINGHIIIETCSFICDFSNVLKSLYSSIYKGTFPCLKSKEFDQLNNCINNIEKLENKIQKMKKELL